MERSKEEIRMTDVAQKTRKEVEIRAGSAEIALYLAEVQHKGWKSIEARKVSTPTFTVKMRKKTRR